jgi:hypothetical protein
MGQNQSAKGVPGVATDPTGLHRTQPEMDRSRKCANSVKEPDSDGLHRKAAQGYETEGHRFESCRARLRTPANVGVHHVPRVCRAIDQQSIGHQSGG